LHPRLKGDFRALRSEGMVYFPGAVCWHILTGYPYLKCNQFQPRKNERIACRLPALLLVTCANYVSTESCACANASVYALLLLCDSVSTLDGIPVVSISPLTSFPFIPHTHEW